MDNIITIVIAIVIIFFLIDGVRRGLVRQIFEIIGLVAAFVCAYYAHNYLAAEYSGAVRVSHQLLATGAAAFVFIAIVIVFHLLGLLFGKIVSVSVLGAVDKVGGGILGACKGILLVSLLCVICFKLPFPESFKDKLRVDPIAARVHPILPRLYESVFHPSSAAPDLKKVVRAGTK